MLGSFLEGAKATIRRAGALDVGTDGVGGEKNLLRSSQDASSRDMRHKDSSSVEGGTGHGVDSSSAAKSVSRSFSLLKASGARAILPVKKALGGDPEVIEARESLTKYKAKLTGAVAEAAAAAATRREERELLTRALAGQENDLQCWGYLSVLPYFRDHRRKETSRAQLLVSMAERREEVISAKLQEVVRLLRSLPIIGPWTNKQRPGGTAGTTATGGGGGHDSESGGQNRGFRNGRYYEEEFAVAPADLLAFDEELAVARRRLLSCDRECAAAADAFAMKVVAAGGLEPRSSEDRTQTLLSLLSRYHVLGDETVTAGCSSSTGEQGHPPAAATAKDDGKGDVAQTKKEEEGGVTDDSDDETIVAKPEVGRDGETAGSEKQEDTNRRQQAAQKHEGVTAQAKDAVQEIEAVNLKEIENGGEMEPTEETGVGIEQEADNATGEKATPVEIDSEAVHKTSDGKEKKPTAAATVDDDDVSDDARRRPAMRVGFSTRTREECEEAFVELMLDERNREGRLLRRFLTMAQAKNSPPTPSSSSAAAGPPPLPAVAIGHPDQRRPVGVGASLGYKIADAASGAFSSMRARSRGASGHNAGAGANVGGRTSGTPNPASAAMAAANASAVGKGDEEGGGGAGTTRRRSAAAETPAGEGGWGKGQEEEDWDGSVGPQVVKAFINYFSKEYLMNKFHVPDVLVPSLTELVALLVFRQARRLVFGYDRRRVMESDLSWREKARKVRAACLLELGAPPEYIPASRTNSEVVTAQEATEAGATKSEECGGTTDDTAVSTEPASSALPDDAGQGAVSSSCDGAAAATVPPESTPAALPTGAEDKLARVEGAPALSEGLAVAASAVHGEEGQGATWEVEDEAAATSVKVAVASTVKKEQEQHKEEEEEEEEGEGDTEGGSAYARASREFEHLGACTTPAEMLGVVKAGMKSLCDDAARISGSDKPLDADTLLPLLVHALVHADLPRVHEALNFLRNFRGPSWGGEEAYYVTCIEAAVSFVLDWNPAADEPELSAAAGAAAADDGISAAPGPESFNDGNNCESKTATKAPAPRRDGGSGSGGGGGDDDGDDAAVAARRAEKAREEEREQQEKGREALLRLGIFLEKHEVQEDTVDVLSSAGWL